MSYTAMTKMKMLVLWEILQQDTDQEHPITTNEICRRLAAREIPCERKSVAVDVALLNQCGYEVMETKVPPFEKHGNQRPSHQRWRKTQLFDKGAVD